MVSRTGALKAYQKTSFDILFERRWWTIKRIIPILLILSFIAFFTLQSSEGTIRLTFGMHSLGRTIFPNATGRWTMDMHWFRTLLHLPLYFLLGCAVEYSLSHFWKAVGICSLVALADETLKIFLPTREFQAVDLGMDAIGFLIGIIIVFLFRCIKKIVYRF